MVAAHLPKSVTLDDTRRPLARTVIEHGRRLAGLKLQVDGQAMPLAGTNARARLIETETALILAGDHLNEVRLGEGLAVASRCRKQVLNVHPATGLQFQPKGIRTMAQVQAEELTNVDELLRCHGD